MTSPIPALRRAQCVKAAGRGPNTRIHALGDGAPWIAEQARARFGTQVRYTLDLYHVCDYLAAAAPEPAAAKLFVAPLRESLRAGEHATVLATLRPRAEPPECPDAQASVRAALRYLGNRPEQLDCANALAHGLPVGSGMIGSGHRHVIQARIKKAGAWRTSAHLHAMCQLRTLRAYRQRDQYRQKNRLHFQLHPACRQASKAASQAHWLARPENRDQLRGWGNVQRAQAWRAANPASDLLTPWNQGAPESW